MAGVAPGGGAVSRRRPDRVPDTMTPANTERVANAIIAVAAIGIAVVVLRTPSLRRLAWNLTRTAVTASIPAWLGQEVQQAWAESGRRVS
jgi:hypothetical protein